MSLYRLIRLAKKTGDRLIVHNETDDSNIVIMDLDNYERLVDFNEPDDFGFGSPYNPTPTPWDKPSTESYPWDIEDYEDEDSFLEDNITDEHDWSHISDIMSGRYGNSSTELAENHDEVPPFYPEDLSDIQPQEADIGDTRSENVSESVYESITPAEPVVDSPSVPSPAGASLSWQEEPLPGDPVFYEEPV